METETMRLLCILQIFFIGKTLGNCPIAEYNNPVSAQFMNTVLTAANANGLYPEVLPTSRPVFQQIEQNFPTFVNPIPRPEVISYQSNLYPTQIQPFPQLVAQPSLEIYPQNVQTLRTIPIRQDFDNTPRLINTKYFSNGFPIYDFGVNDVNCQRNVFGTLEVIDNNIADVGCVNVEPPKIPYNIEINLPVLTSTLPNAPSYVAPYPMPPIMPPIVIEESSSSSGIWKWLPLLVGLMSNNNNNCNCNNNCNNCNCGCNCRFPFPFPISTSSPIINTVVPSAAGTTTTTT